MWDIKQKPTNEKKLNSQTQTTVWWLPEGWEENEEGKGAKYKVMEGNQPSSGENIVQHTENILQNWIFETYIMY